MPPPPRPAVPFFSEYVEGGGSRKGVEIVNAGDEDLDITTCQVNVYANGAIDPGQTFRLDGGLLGPGGVFVLCRQELEDAGAVCDQIGGVNWNGNDAVELVCGGEVADVIGQIGFDPGRAWANDGVSTVNATLRRHCDVETGDLDGGDEFDPSLEWRALPIDTFDDLGFWHCLE